MRRLFTALTMPFLLGGVLSCSYDTSNRELPVTEIITEAESFDFEDHFSDLEVIPLKGDFVMGQIGWIGKANNKIFAYDSNIGDIKVFDEDYVFLESFSRQGQAPGEYNDIDRLFVNNDGIFIFSNLQAAIFKYNFDYEFEEKIPIERYSYSVISAGDKIISYQNFGKFSDPDYNLKSINYQGVVETRKKKISLNLNQLVGFSGGIYPDLTRAAFYYNPPLSDTLIGYNSSLDEEAVFLFEGLVPDPFENGLYNASYNPGVRNSHGHIYSLSAAFSDYMVAKYKDNPYLKTALVDLKDGVYYRISPKNEKALKIFVIDNPSFIDEEGWVYSFTGPLFYRGHSFFKDLLESQGIDEKEAESEDFNFLIRFKVKRDQGI